MVFSPTVKLYCYHQVVDTSCKFFTESYIQIHYFVQVVSHHLSNLPKTYFWEAHQQLIGIFKSHSFHSDQLVSCSIGASPSLGIRQSSCSFLKYYAQDTSQLHYCWISLWRAWWSHSWASSLWFYWFQEFLGSRHTERHSCRRGNGRKLVCFEQFRA